MLTFESDYVEGAHPKILEELVETNMVQVSGYGSDPFTESAKKKIIQACGRENAQVYLMAGGTQTNALIIDTMLEPYEGVVTAETGHIAVHEAGAVEFTGHKVLTIPHHNGKMDPAELRAYLETFWKDGNHEHMVFPGMVYITHPTEFGTLYTRNELQQIGDICKEYEIPLFLDGARLGYGLMSNDTDVDLPFIAQTVDVFYIGGTKIGALIGEAVVFTHSNMPKHFITRVKQHGAMLAKGRLIGIQFDALFTDDLYFKISRHAIEMAEILKQTLKDKGYTFFMDSPTNQQFIVLENSQMEELKKHVGFSFWETVDEDHTAVRFATSWATTEENLRKLAELL
ncbi:MAG: low specificity L-threonine aldolase [Solobacterium sp.]|nr:low specificity L-threonine aldolase [Solobacterium sp.]